MKVSASVLKNYIGILNLSDIVFLSSQYKKIYSWLFNQKFYDTWEQGVAQR